MFLNHNDTDLLRSRAISAMVSSSATLSIDTMDLNKLIMYGKVFDFYDITRDNTPSGYGYILDINPIYVDERLYQIYIDSACRLNLINIRRAINNFFNYKSHYYKILDTNFIDNFTTLRDVFSNLRGGEEYVGRLLASMKVLTGTLTSEDIELPTENSDIEEWRKFDRQIARLAIAYYLLIFTHNPLIYNLFVITLFKITRLETITYKLSLTSLLTRLNSLSYQTLEILPDRYKCYDDNIFYYLNEHINEFPEGLKFLNKETYGNFMKLVNEREEHMFS